MINMKYSIIYLIAILFVVLQTGCEKAAKHFNHKYYGAWEVKKTEYYTMDSTSGTFKLQNTQNDCGSMYLYDQKSDDQNECYYDFPDSLKPEVISILEGSSIADGKCYWFADQHDRLTFWYMSSSLDFYIILRIKKISANNHEWTYIAGNTIKEVLTVERVWD